MSSRKLPDRPTTIGAGGSLADWPKSASDVRRQRLSRQLQKLAMQAAWRTNVTRTKRRRMRVDERQNTQRRTLVNRARRRRLIGARTRDEDAGERCVPRDQRDQYVRDVSSALVERVDGLGVARFFSYPVQEIQGESAQHMVVRVNDISTSIVIYCLLGYNFLRWAAMRMRSLMSSAPEPDLCA